MIRGLAVKLAGIVPTPLRQWVYRHPALYEPLSRILKRATSGNGEMIVTIAAGPNRGLKMAVDDHTPNFFWLKDDYEKDVVDTLRSVIRPGMTVADIGAHIGFTTLLLAQLVGPTGTVIAFEPDPQSFARLRRNIDLNALTNVHLRPEAVADRPGTLRFAAQGETTSHLASHGEEGVDVPVVSLDDLPYRFDLIKIDVEGHEASVLQGMSRILQGNNRPALLIELHGPRPAAACGQFLRSAHYSLQSIPPSPNTDHALAGHPAQNFITAHVLCLPT
jgi:FkbM family methyltransferase